MKRLPFILVLICTLSFIACNKKDDPTGPNNDPSTLTAYIGDTITIAGKNLGTDIRTLMVKFGTVPANIISVSETSASVVVPDDLQESNLKIHLFSANNEFISNFKLKAPVIVSVSPNEGSAGQQVVVTGKGFSKSRQISFGDKLLNAYYQSNSSLSIKVPDSIPTGKYAISLTVAGLKTAAPELFNVIPFTPPTFTGFSPETAFIGDTIILEGQHLGNNADALAVNFGNVQAKVVSVSETSARVVVPDDIAAASVKIKLISGLTEFTSTKDFQLKAPVIDSIDITSGFSGQRFIIYGKGFRDSYNTEQVVFGDTFIPAAQGVSGHSVLIMSVPGGLAAGKYPIKVTIAGMTSTAIDLFEVVVPIITSFTPNSVRAGSIIYITGTNLSSSGFLPQVRFVDFETGLDAGITTSFGVVKANEVDIIIPASLKNGTYRIILSVFGSEVKTTETFTVKNITP